VLIRLRIFETLAANGHANVVPKSVMTCRRFIALLPANPNLSLSWLQRAGSLFDHLVSASK